jgi:S-adenosylmethionine decarboxylase proenzyme
VPDWNLENRDPQHLFEGLHLIGEFYGVAAELLDNGELLAGLLQEGISLAGATLCQTLVKQFEPQGVTVLCLLAESHVSLHTYPEHGALFFDSFTCSITCRPHLIVETLREALHPSDLNLRVLRRGKGQANI